MPRALIDTALDFSVSRPQKCHWKISPSLPTATFSIYHHYITPTFVPAQVSLPSSECFTALVPIPTHQVASLSHLKSASHPQCIPHTVLTCLLSGLQRHQLLRGLESLHILLSTINIITPPPCLREALHIVQTMRIQIPTRMHMADSQTAHDLDKSRTIAHNNKLVVLQLLKE